VCEKEEGKKKEGIYFSSQYGVNQQLASVADLPRRPPSALAAAQFALLVVFGFEGL
jgi:hypothetical protein